jgi:hypothetical protein
LRTPVFSFKQVLLRSFIPALDALRVYIDTSLGPVDVLVKNDRDEPVPVQHVDIGNNPGDQGHISVQIQSIVEK